MAYVTQAQVESRFGTEALAQLTDREGSGGVDTGVLAAAIADAGALIDGYLAPRYTLPLGAALIAASPLVRHAGAIVFYLLHEDRATEQARRLYEDAVAWLKDVRAGRASLGEQDTAVPVPAGQIRIDYPTGAAIDWDTF